MTHRIPALRENPRILNITLEKAGHFEYLESSDACLGCKRSWVQIPPVRPKYVPVISKDFHEKPLKINTAECAYFFGILPQFSAFIQGRFGDASLLGTFLIGNILENARGEFMAKRFTDSNKWRNAWFRALPLKAKIVWVYLCDECDLGGVWKSDFELASFQVNFKFGLSDLKNWFGDKIFAFGEDNILIVQFFEFQYGASKDTWMAKIRARERLEGFGFVVEDNKVIPSLTHSPPTIHDSGGRRLSIGIGIGIGKGKEGSASKKRITATDIEPIYKKYPRKEGKSAAFKKLISDLKTPEDLKAFEAAVAKYSAACEARGTESKFIKHFSTFANEWRDWLDDSVGSVNIRERKFGGFEYV